MWVTAVQTIAQVENSRLTRGKRFQKGIKLFVKQLFGHGIGRLLGVGVFDKVTQFGIFIIARGLFQVQQRPSNILQPANAAHRHFHLFGQLFRGRRPAFVLLKLLGKLIEPPQPGGLVGGNADHAAIVCQSAGHALANPPGGVGAKAVAAPIVVFVYSAKQTDVAFLYQIKEI